MQTKQKERGVAALKLALNKAGGVNALSNALAITHGAVSQWEVVPAKRVLAVAAITGISPADLRPDLYPDPVTLAGMTPCPMCDQALSWDDDQLVYICTPCVKAYSVERMLAHNHFKACEDERRNTYRVSVESEEGKAVIEVYAHDTKDLASKIAEEGWGGEGFKVSWRLIKEVPPPVHDHRFTVPDGHGKVVGRCPQCRISIGASTLTGARALLKSKCDG